MLDDKDNQIINVGRGWQRAVHSDLSAKLSSALNSRTPLRDRIRDICYGVFGAPLLSQAQADTLRPLLRQLSADLNACGPNAANRIIADFEYNLIHEVRNG